MTLEREDLKTTLSCTAEGNPKPKFEIFLNGSIRVVNGSTHVIHKVTSSNIAVYTCKATNVFGSITSTKIHLKGKNFLLHHNFVLSLHFL